MFSGKTEELIRRVERARLAGNEVEVFTPELDHRYGQEKVASHSGREIEARPVETGTGLREIRRSSADIVAVDEANFFGPGLVEACQELADSGTRVVVSGTDQNFRGEPFTPVPELMAVAEEVEKLNAVCAECGRPATRNQRLVDGEPAPADGPEIRVGGEDSYEARCRRCHELG
jgi:thymidine kinase